MSWERFCRNADRLLFRPSDKVRKGYKQLRVNFTIQSDATAEQLAELTTFSPVHEIVSNPVPVEISFTSV